MKGMRAFLCAAMMLAMAAVAHAQAGAAAYQAWQDEHLIDAADPHFYLNTELLSLSGAELTMRIGVGGPMPQYDISIQSVQIVEDSDDPIDLGSPVTGTWNHNGGYAEGTHVVALHPDANAIKVSLTPRNYPDGDGTSTLVLGFDAPGSGFINDIGAAIPGGDCLPPCYEATGNCENCPNGGKVGPKCCKGKSAILNCPKCKIKCANGDC